MTPLLWAFPDNNLPRFTWLLEHGANPNVVIESDFNTRGGMHPGDSVTLMACRTAFPGYFDAVFENGGDPNIRHTGQLGFQSTPLFEVLKKPHATRKEKVARLINLGADVNALASGVTPLMCVVTRSGGCDVALKLLEAEADYRAYNESDSFRLMHILVKQEPRLGDWSPENRAKFYEVVKWLEDHGESYEQAKEDLKRWDSWSRTNGEFRRKMDAEIAERKAREKSAEQKAHE